MGIPFKLKLPTADDLKSLIQKKGRGCYIYTADISRAYRQLPVDPLDWPLLCISHEGKYYIDISQPFGLRTAALACQRTTDAVRWIMQQQELDSLNYLDDFAGAESLKQQADHAYDSLRSLLATLGLPEATAKGTAPAQVATWIGLEFDTIKMEIRIPPDKLESTLKLVRDWQHKSSATLTSLDTCWANCCIYHNVLGQPGCS